MKLIDHETREVSSYLLIRLDMATICLDKQIIAPNWQALSKLLEVDIHNPFVHIEPAMSVALLNLSCAFSKLGPREK
jgi:hypothetical protein